MNFKKCNIESDAVTLLTGGIDDPGDPSTSGSVAPMNWNGVIIGVTIGAVVLIVIIALTVYFCSKKKSKIPKIPNIWKLQNKSF